MTAEAALCVWLDWTSKAKSGLAFTHFADYVAVNEREEECAVYTLGFTSQNGGHKPLAKLFLILARLSTSAARLVVLGFLKGYKWHTLFSLSEKPRILS